VAHAAGSKQPPSDPAGQLMDSPPRGLVAPPVPTCGYARPGFTRGAGCRMGPRGGLRFSRGTPESRGLPSSRAPGVRAQAAAFPLTIQTHRFRAARIRGTRQGAQTIQSQEVGEPCDGRTTPISITQRALVVHARCESSRDRFDRPLTCLDRNNPDACVRALK